MNIDRDITPRTFRALTPLLVVMLLVGCASTGSPDATSRSNQVSTGVEDERVRSGERLTIDGEEVQIVGGYLAASGRRCARVRSIDDGAERIACRNDSGDWTLRRALGALIGDSVLMPDGLDRRASDRRSVDDVVNVTSVIVQPGESLLAVAVRTTGNERYWHTIAELNDIKNPDLIHAGQALRVPALDAALDAQ